MIGAPLDISARYSKEPCWNYHVRMSIVHGQATTQLTSWLLLPGSCRIPQSRQLRQFQTACSSKLSPRCIAAVRVDRLPRRKGGSLDAGSSVRQWETNSWLLLFCCSPLLLFKCVPYERGYSGFLCQSTPKDTKVMGESNILKVDSQPSKSAPTEIIGGSNRDASLAN